MSRLPPLQIDEMTPEQRRVHDDIANGPRGSVRGPFPVLVRSPGLADHVQKAGGYLRYESALPGKLRELAILVVARHWGAGYEWAAHAPIAESEGLASATVESIRVGAAPDFEDPAEAAVHAFCTEVLTASEAGDATYAAALDLLGEEGLVDLVGLMGYYCLVSFTLNVFRIEPPGGPPSFI